ncbi:histidinol-phosphatase [Cupriavidus sp. WKF15]|uniref:histidinol-phosphatase n=1 Tax=Cupriavidus sp. WKF15 TaxID=3032282 RepID=UPI0023E193ED|nr:histidinol-phosphatase [Cupriavidus sp. WKF15]WER48943.1 histidinol-phosphatase [Cupriavidus sp. WKF15]
MEPQVDAAELRPLSAFASKLADVARARAMHYFRSDVEIAIKTDASPVTRADREIESELRSLIANRYPHHAFFGEESGGSIGAGLGWVIDPIDGTKSFICGVPLFGCLIALLEDGKPVLGLIEMPALRERWVGYAGRTTFNETPARVNACTSLKDARLFATSPDMFDGQDADAFSALSREVGMRRFGTDCYAYGLLASGLCDLVVEANLEIYDVVALVPVIENAGGIVTDWNGRPIDKDFSGRLLAAATPALHRQAMAALRRR